MTELAIVHEEAGVIAVAKPAGLATTGKDLGDVACVQFRLQSQMGRPVWAVHQLDQGTTGINLFVTKKRLVAEWASRLKAGTKTYVALCHGAADWASRSVEGPIGWSSAQRRRWVVEGGKDALTKVQVLARSPRHCAVVAHPQTGRTHQVRIHLASIGHPLLGERRYRRRACRRLDRPALHLAELRLPGLPHLVVPVPADMLQVASELRLELPATGERSGKQSSGGK